jgi:hypothetical protein
MYGDSVLKLRKEVASLKARLGEKGDANDDLFGEKQVGPHELADLQREEERLVRQGCHDERREAEHARAMAEVGHLRGGVRDVRPRKPSNAHLFVSEEEFKRTGGM